MGIISRSDMFVAVDNTVIAPGYTRGRHRTGVVGAVYRFQHDSWNVDQAYAEMTKYEFDSGFGHGKQKDFVQDYW